MIRHTVILGNLGRIITIVGIAMLTCLPWSLIYREDVVNALLQASALTLVMGALLSFVFFRNEAANFKEGFVLVSLGWVAASLFGTLPYLLSGYLPCFADAWFETVSGFTTTGASVVSDVEAWPKGLLFWRSLTQWLGGMGIIVLFVAIITSLGVRAKQLFKAEAPGPVAQNISPRIRETARKLWLAYVLISLACLAALYACGMDFFDALCHTFTTMATGGFSTKNTSIAFYASPLIEWTVILFMFIVGCNFALHIFSFQKRNPLTYWKNEEFRLYTGIMVVAILVVTLVLYQFRPELGVGHSLRTACFQIVSIVTTTGFVTADYNQWPPLAMTMMMLLLFIGGCSGSTGGGMKPGRYLIILQRIKIEFKKMVHPKAVLPLRFGGRFIKEDMLLNVLVFFFLYIGLWIGGAIFLTALDIDILSSLSASATCLGNVGPGLNMVGPTQNFAMIPELGKYFLSIWMLIGRLEIYPILVLFMPNFWQER